MIGLTIHKHKLKFWKNQFCFLSFLVALYMYVWHTRHFQFWLRGTNDLCCIAAMCFQKYEQTNCLEEMQLYVTKLSGTLCLHVLDK